MELIADGLLILAACCASLYCLVLSRRLRRLNRLDNGLGGAIASLSTQVDEMHRALAEAKTVTERSKRELDSRTKRAEEAAGRLELLLAAVREPRPEGAPAANPQAREAAATPVIPSAEAAANPVPVTTDIDVPPPADVALEEVPAASEAFAPPPGSDPIVTPEPAPTSTEAPNPDVPLQQNDPAASPSEEAAGPASLGETPTDKPQADKTTADEEPASENLGARTDAALQAEDRADDELRMVDALTQPDQALAVGESGISEELLQALDKMAGRGGS